MFDVHRHPIDAVERARRMRRGEDGGGYPLAAAEIAPGETTLPGRRLDSGHERHMIEPSRRQHWLEVPQIRDIGGIAFTLSHHCAVISSRSARRPRRRVTTRSAAACPLADSIEVHEQANLASAQSKIGQHLGVVKRQESLDGLYFDN